MPCPASEQLEPSEQLEAADRAREAGNAKIRSGDVASAKDLYEEALQILKQEGGQLLNPGGGSDTELDFATRCRQCLCAVQLNLALCHLKAKPCEGGKALELCEEVLIYDPDNVKACYRKGKALLELGELKEAEWEFSRACKLAPTDKSIRQDLVDLRKQLRDSHRSAQEKAKQAFEGIFDRGAGFASSGREDRSSAAAAAAARSSSRDAYRFLTDAAENPFTETERPAEAALALQDAGKFAEALSAWEAALRQTQLREEWPEHRAHWLSLGCLFMDMNCDALALRCFDSIVEAAEPPPAALPGPRQQALLLRAICSLNESALEDPIGEVSVNLEEWLAGEVAAGTCTLPEPAEASLEARLASWRSSSRGADAAVAHGVLLLLQQREGAAKAFCEALEAASDDAAGFSPRYVSSRWNMLGAVCANIRNYKAALVAYGQALALQPHYPRAKANEGIALYNLGDDLGALASYVGALTAVPEWAASELWQLLSKVAESCGDDAGLAQAILDRNVAVLKDFAEPRAGPPPALLKPQEALRLMGFAAPPAEEEAHG